MLDAHHGTGHIPLVGVGIDDRAIVVGDVQIKSPILDYVGGTGVMKTGEERNRLPHLKRVACDGRKVDAGPIDTVPDKPDIEEGFGILEIGLGDEIVDGVVGIRDGICELFGLIGPEDDGFRLLIEFGRLTETIPLEEGPVERDGLRHIRRIGEVDLGRDRLVLGEVEMRLSDMVRLVIEHHLILVKGNGALLLAGDMKRERVPGDIVEK